VYVSPMVLTDVPKGYDLAAIDLMRSSKESNLIIPGAMEFNLIIASQCSCTLTKAIDAA